MNAPSAPRSYTGTERAPTNTGNTNHVRYRNAYANQR